MRADGEPQRIWNLCFIDSHPFLLLCTESGCLLASNITRGEGGGEIIATGISFDIHHLTAEVETLNQT